MTASGSLPECRLLARIAQKLTGRCWHHKPNGRKLPSLKKSAVQLTTPFRSFPVAFVSEAYETSDTGLNL